jgi:hypothetical protein
MNEIGPDDRHEVDSRLSNPAENSHRFGDESGISSPGGLTNKDHVAYILCGGAPGREPVADHRNETTGGDREIEQS